MTPDFRPRRALATLWRDRRGVSAVEFALIAPVLLLFYCGMAELTEAMIAQRRLSHLASSIGDVVARSTQLSDDQSADVFKVGAVLMAPFPTTDLHMCIVSVVSDATGRDTVEWSDSSNAPADCPAAGAVLDIPVSVLPASHSVIMSKASYDYESPIKLVAPKAIAFKRTFYLRPRLSDKVLRVR
ncbi:pilus assembly protein TadE [Caulobacter sp. Root655]|uniref:TadE/TadG family type IV pilus assembly protein n=1 Tax=Caulobacter sp. Root655 TaxID=1736578 RepID=UPI0006FD4788|nr:TadE/TadG family type IV pilus assembly protein [Caulobacter sp. Root655]KRA66073.1 pilus assembly protein TadE [Caulobacter sp. Root655]